MFMGMLSFLACAPEAEKQTFEIPDRPEDTAEPFDPGDASLVIELENISFSTPLPVQVYRTNEETGDRRLVARGTTGSAIEVGVGDVAFEVGPHVELSASGVDYYPTSDDYTQDGLPIITASERRYVLPPLMITVDQEEEHADARFVGVVGEGTYRCTWSKYELDEEAMSKRGDKITDLSEETGLPYVSGWIGFEEGTYLAPDPASAVAGCGGALYEGDRLRIVPTPDGIYESNIALESLVGNELVEGSTVKGAGLNNFQVGYVNRMEGATYNLDCRYDWSDFSSSYY